MLNESTFFLHKKFRLWWCKHTQEQNTKCSMSTGQQESGEGRQLLSSEIWGNWTLSEYTLSEPSQSFINSFGREKSVAGQAQAHVAVEQCEGGED